MGLFVTVFSILALVGAAVLHGVCLRILWGWYLVPLGAPGIGTATAIGLTLIVSLLTHSGDQASRFKKGDELEALFSVFAGPLVSLGLGWFVRFFL